MFGICRPSLTLPALLRCAPMNRDVRNQVILAEMARATRATHPDADWHEVEPVLRDIWDHAPRRAGWDAVRGDAALHWRFGAALPPSAAVIEPSSTGGVPDAAEGVR